MFKCGRLRTSKKREWEREKKKKVMRVVFLYFFIIIICHVFSFVWFCWRHIVSHSQHMHEHMLRRVLILLAYVYITSITSIFLLRFWFLSFVRFLLRMKIKNDHLHIDLDKKKMTFVFHLNMNSLYLISALMYI